MVKRYVKEEGSEEVRDAYLRAYSGDQTLAYSIWNVGEVLGALGKAARTRRLREGDYVLARSRFLSETRRMAKLGVASVVSIRASLLKDSWALLEEKHLYEADALQVVTARFAGADRFMTGDSTLFGVAKELGLACTLLG